MPFDGISANYIKDEIEEALKGARVSNISQPARYDLLLQFRNKGKSICLFLSANPSRPALYLSSKPAARSAKLPPFCQLLRRMLPGAELTDVEQESCERLFRFTFQSKNELGDEVRKILVAELMGRHSNIMLLREDGIIHDSIRHIDHQVNRLRELMPARPYTAPPPQGKFLPEELLSGTKEGELFPFLLPDESENSSRDILRVLNANLAGFSPLLCRELLYRSHIREEQRLMSLSEAERQTLSKELRQLLEEIVSRKKCPAIYAIGHDDQNVRDFHVLPLRLYKEKQSFSSLSACMNAFYGEAGEREHFLEEARVLRREIKRLQKQNERKIALHEDDLSEGEKAEEYRKKGELLQSRVYDLKEHLPYLDIEDYYQEDLPLIRIQLDESLSPADNVAMYFKRYRKAKEKRLYASEYLKHDRSEQDWLRSLETAIDLAETREDLRAIRVEVEEETERKNSSMREEPAAIPTGQLLNPGKPGKKKYKAGGKKQNPRKAKKKTVSPSEPRRFLSRSGFLLESGRNNLDNERLTFKKSRKDDLWFHAQNIPGSHVILHCEGQLPTPGDIEDAACLAAWYSSGNRSELGAKLSIDYCPVKQVSKIKGGRPGQVHYRNYQTITLEAKAPLTFLRPFEPEDSAEQAEKREGKTD